MLTVLDTCGLGRRATLTSESRSLNLVLAGSLVMAALMAVVMGLRLPRGLMSGRREPGTLVVAGLWVLGLWLTSRVRSLPWPPQGPPPELLPAVRQEKKKPPPRGRA